jgi:hypothetical protein
VFGLALRALLPHRIKQEDSEINAACVLITQTWLSTDQWPYRLGYVS